MTDQLHIRVPTELRNAVERLAAELRLSHAAVVRRAIGCLVEIEDARSRGLTVGAARTRGWLDLVLGEGER